MTKILPIVVSAALLLCTQAYAAADWVRSHQSMPGIDVCINRAGIVTDKEGITHYEVDLDAPGCANQHPKKGIVSHFAVDCSQDFSKPVAVRQHILAAGGQFPVTDHWVDRVYGSDDGFFFDAKNACGK